MDTMMLRQLIVNDGTLDYAERQTLLNQVRIAEAQGPTISFDVARLVSMGLGALAGYLFASAAGGSSFSRLAGGALGAFAGGLLAPSPDQNIGFGRGYFSAQ